MTGPQHLPKTFSKSLAVLGLGLAMQSVSAIELQYEVVDLGANFEPTAISDNGSIVGIDTSGSDPVAVRYNASGLEALAGNSIASGVNKGDTMVGYEMTQPDHRALSWLDGQLSEQLAQFSNLLEARAINGGDEITGFRMVDNQYQRAFVYDSFTASLSTLQTLGGANAWAYAINNRGHVTGASEDGNGNIFGFRFNTVEVESLGNLDGYQHSAGLAINDLNEVVGHVFNRDEARSGSRAIYNREFEGLINLGSLDNDTDSVARAINNNTLIIGQSSHSNGQQRAFLFDTSTAGSLVLTVDPIIGGTIYTGSSQEGGVTQSSDRGLNPLTINNGLLNRSINQIIVDPADSDTLYLGTNDGAYRSTNQGLNWEYLSNDLENRAVFAIHIDPEDRETLYAGTNVGIYYSDDGGANWTISPETTGFATYNFINSVEDSAVYAATSKGVHKSVNKGETWSQHNGNEQRRLFVRNIADIVIDPNVDPPLMYAASLGGGIYRSTDLNLSTVLWDRVNDGLGSRNIRDLEIDDTVSPSIIYAGTDRAMYQLIPSGSEIIEDEWEPVPGFSAFGTNSIALDKNRTPKDIYASTLDGGAFRNTYGTDGTLPPSWTSITTGVTTADVYALLPLPHSNTLRSKIFAASSNGIFSADINGTDDPDVADPRLNLSWIAPTSGASGVKLTALAVDNSQEPQHLWAGSSHQGVYMSEDAGTTWFNVTRGLDNRNIQDLVVDSRAETAVVFAATMGGVYRSDDGGLSWQGASDGLASLSVLSLALDRSSNPQILYAGTIDGIFRSTDQGRNWTPANLGLENIDINGILINPQDNQQLLAASGSAGLFRSLDQGQSWESLNQGSSATLTDTRINDMVLHPANNGELVVATYSGVHQLSDAFCTSASPCWDWLARNNGIETLTTFAVSINPDAHNEYIIGTDEEGAYKSLDSGANWSQIDDGLAAEIIRILDLNDLLESNPDGWRLEDAVAINNSGQIVGTGQLNGEKHGYRLDPVLGTLSADLRLRMVPQPDVLKPDIPMSYEITITNLGPESATGIQFTDWLPHNVIFRHTSSSRGICAKEENRDIVRCDLGALSPGDETHVTVSLEPTDPELKIHNIARVTANEYDPDLSNNTQGLNSPVYVDRCFIATAAYGSFLHPHVTELRGFRDQYLMTNAAGRWLVEQYYRYSPPLAESIRDNAFARGASQVVLTPIVYGVMYPGTAGLLILAVLMAVSYRRRRLGLAH